MEYRNPRYNRHGTIDIELDHPTLGTIPFTASPNDPNEHGREIYAALIAAGGISPYEPPAGE